MAAIVTLTVASLGMLAWQQLTDSAVAVGNTATNSGMTLEVARAVWSDMGMVHDGQGGFLMPDQMMPGAPRGQEVRLGVEVTLANTGSGVRGFDLAQEFTLVGGTRAEPAPLKADTIGELPRLASGAAVDGTLYFDVEAPADGDPPFHLRWTRDGRTVEITVPLNGNPPQHDH